jgi:exodeoxyribonuclease VII small subunit
VDDRRDLLDVHALDLVEHDHDALLGREPVEEAIDPGHVLAPLEESLRVFEEGIALARHCARYLEDAERRIELLAKDESGATTTRPFSVPADEEL